MGFTLEAPNQPDYSYGSEFRHEGFERLRVTASRPCRAVVFWRRVLLEDGKRVFEYSYALHLMFWFPYKLGN